MSINRRSFIKHSSIVGGLLSTDLLADLPFKPKTSAPLDLNIFATNWGFQGGDIFAFTQKVKDEGYDGIEIWAPNKYEQQQDFLEAVSKHDLKYGFLAGNSGSNYTEHFDAFQKQLENAISLKPLFINCHSGKDFFTLDESKQFIEYASRQAKLSGLPIYHETHRGRILFNPQICKTLLEQYDDLRLTLDISHWCVVASSLLEDQQEAVDLALTRTDHIHSRIGFNQGAQVTDPRAPEFANPVKAHFTWWDTVVNQKLANNQPLTMTTEFGPPDYLWTTPYTRMPLANQWDINVYMMNEWRRRYQ